MHSSDDNEVVAWFKARKVQSVCLSAIYDERGRVMGFASCEFILRPALNTDEICEKIQMETKNLANGVAMAMDLGLLPREED